ncbi:MAG: hypothetical protein AAB786_02430 [Patescibacteria group bacterium]
MPWVTYDHETYYSDAWDPFSYGKEVKNDKSFLDQFLDLLKVIPQPGVRRGENSPNSNYSFYGKDMKDCFYVFGGRRSEDVMYSSSIYDSKHVADSYFVKKVDTAYDSIRTTDSYNVKYAYFSSNCIDCDFIFDCRNCQNCFSCVNLRNKNYCWFNEQLSKEEFQKRKSEVDLGSRSVFEECRKKFWNLVKANPIRATRIYKSQNVSGDDIITSHNCQNCFQLEGCENLRYVAFAIVKLKDSMDIGFSGGAEKEYDCQNTGNQSSNIKFSYAVKESFDCEYLMSCRNCQNCFGCVGLKNASYCIFNKKYSPEEYWQVLDEVKTKMLEGGIYGEFFPMSFSPYPYNSSFAHIIYPMTQTEARSRGLYWQEDLDVDTKGLKTILVNELPDNINNVTEEVCNLVVIGEESKKPFKITSREIDFYKQNKIPLPIDTPQQRILDRFKILNNFQIYQENCASCEKQIESSYKKFDEYRPYCEECYLKEVI